MEVVLIVLGVLVLALVVWAVMRKQKERRLEGRREEAGELRQHARQRELEAERGEAEAEERAARARREAAAAEQQAAEARRVKAEASEHEQRAAEVDPDIDRDAEAERQQARS
jgi:FtsZ-interacting cell division protein ZipA